MNEDDRTDLEILNEMFDQAEADGSPEDAYEVMQGILYRIAFNHEPTTVALLQERIQAMERR